MNDFLSSFGARREAENEFRAGSDFTGDVDGAANLLDDSVNDAQAEAGALGLLFCREERIKNLRQDLPIDTRSCVCNAHDNLIALHA